MSSQSHLPHCRVMPPGEFNVMIWSKSKSGVEFQYGGCLGKFNGMSSHSNLPHCRVLPLGKFSVMIPELRVTAGCCRQANSIACHPRATYHIAGCCHLVNSMSQFQSYMPHCRVQPPGEINVMIMSHCRV